MRKTLLGLLLAAGCALAAAQPISADEMIQLERLHDEMTAKGVRVTPEMEGRMLQRIRALGALNADPRRAASPPPMLAVAPAATSTTSLSEPELLRRLQELQASAQPIGAIEYLRDGLVVDGRRFADPEGRTTGVSVDAATGRVGYFVEGAVPGSGTLKLARADRPAEAVTIGRLQREGAGWQLTTVTGATLTGELFFPLTDGALLMRDSVGFRYVAGRGVEQVTVPTGWYPTPLQRGNVATTGWLLLEKDTPKAAPTNPLATLASLGKIVGAVDAHDYALMEMKTGRLVEIDLSVDGKDTAKYSDCRRKNVLFNACSKVTTYESLFQPDGRRNPGHYFWNIDWERTADGPILLAREGSLGARLTGTDLDSGKKVLLFERTLGVRMEEVRLSADGKLRLGVGLGFSSDAIDDVAEVIRSRPAIGESNTAVR